jgi:hypothetical protein
LKKQKKNSNLFNPVFVGYITIRKGVHIALEAWDKSKIKGTFYLVGKIDPIIMPLIKKYIEFINEKMGVPDNIVNSATGLYQSILQDFNTRGQSQGLIFKSMRGKDLTDYKIDLPLSIKIGNYKSYPCIEILVNSNSDIAILQNISNNIKCTINNESNITILIATLNHKNKIMDKLNQISSNINYINILNKD